MSLPVLTPEQLAALHDARAADAAHGLMEVTPIPTMTYWIGTNAGASRHYRPPAIDFLLSEGLLRIDGKRKQRIARITDAGLLELSELEST